uniref:NOF_10 protein n=1 Tax=Fopius arisanus TaxID=64838 RepID=A0A0C9RJP6_9HYME
MPRVSLVPRDEAIAVLEKYIDHFKTNDFPSYSDPVWKEISKDLGLRWSHHNCYTSVRENRRKILTAARENQGIFIPEEVPEKKPKRETSEYTGLEMLYQDEEDLELDDDVYNDSKLLNLTDDLSDFEVDADAAGLGHFDILITRDEWREMKGYSKRYNKRHYAILNPGIWTNILALAVTRQTKLPCAFVFDNSKIYESANSLHYLKIKGHCKSKACQNLFFGYVDRDPGDNDFYMSVRMRDTMGETHEDVHRPLKGLAKTSRRKKKFGDEVVSEGSSSMRQQAAKYVNIFLCRRCSYPNIINRRT